MKKLKVLIIPSWYPNKKDPLWGNYFIKQATSLSEYIDITMLHIERVGLKEVNKFIKEKSTDGFNNSLYNFRFYKKSILNFKNISLDYSYKNYIKAGYKAYLEIKKITGKFDVILVESILPAGLLANYIKQKEKIPFVVHAHSESIMTNKYYTKYIIPIMNNADNYMAVNQTIKEKVESIINKPCHLVPNYIDCNLFSLKNDRKDNKIILLNVSNFYKVKCLDILIKALDIVINKKGYKNVYLKIVGVGECKSEYEKLVDNLKLNKYIEFLGYIPNKDLPNIYKESDILCVSSSFETFCIPIVEALSSGIPVITTNCGGPKEIVNEDNSIITKVNDVDEYAKSIIKMIKNYNKYNKKEIRNYAVNKYDKKVVCKKIINILKECINNE